MEVPEKESNSEESIKKHRVHVTGFFLQKIKKNKRKKEKPVSKS